MSKKTEKDAQPEALATFAAAARNKGVKPASQGVSATAHPDAHSTRELDLTHWGVEMARKGGVPKDRVLNCLRKDELAAYLEKRRDRRRVKRVSLHRGSSGPRTSAAGTEKEADV